MALPEGRDFYVGTLDETPSAGMKHTHIHDYYEILYLLDGKRRFLVNHTLYDLQPYDVMLIKEGDVHISQAVNSEEKYTRYLITFNDAFLSSLEPAFNREVLTKAFDSEKLHIPETFQKSFNVLLHRAAEKTAQPDTLSQYVAKLCVIEFLINLTKCSSNSIAPLMDSITVYEERIQEVCRHICNFYNQQITLEQMAKIAYMSPTYFSKKFKSVTGFGFKEYLNFIRIKMATNLLMETQYSVTEIAAYCGYHDSNYFGDVFKRIVGTSPNKYRKQHYML